MLTIVGQLEVNRRSTTTLVVADHGTSGVAGSGVLASRSIGHAVDDVQVGILIGSNVEVGHREAALIRATGERRSRRGGARRARGAGATGAVGAGATGATGAGGARGATFGDGTGDTFLGL